MPRNTEIKLIMLKAQGNYVIINHNIPFFVIATNDNMA